MPQIYETEGMLDPICGETIPGEPLVEVCSIIVQGYSKIINYLVYGEIYVENKKRDKKFHFYKRPRDSPDSVRSGTRKSLSLISLDKAALSMDALPIVFKLKVKKEGVSGNGSDSGSGGDDAWFLDKIVQLDSKRDSRERVGTLEVRSDLGKVTLNYFVMPVAVLAEVMALDFKFKKKDGRSSCSSQVDDAHADVHVSGNIIARYGEMASALKTGSKDHELVLFKKVSKWPQKLHVGERIELARSSVSMPSYATIQLEVDLSLKKFGTNNENHVIKGVLEVIPRQGPYALLHGESVSLEVCVAVSHPERLCYKVLKQSHKHPTRIPQSIYCTPEVIHSHVIVFSIFVCQYNKDDDWRVCGKIAVEDDRGRRHLFKRDENHYCILSRPSGTIPLSGKLTFHEWYFCLISHITDAETGDEISYGFLEYPDLNMAFSQDFYNRPLCTVIPGEHGYVAVHYGVFPYVVWAVVNVCVTPKSFCEEVTVSGTLMAHIGGFQCSTSYEKEYYRLTLIEGDRRCKSSKSFAIQSSALRFAVPEWASLIFDVNLSVMDSKDSKVTERFEGTMEIEIGDEKLREIPGESFDFSLSIQFKA